MYFFFSQLSQLCFSLSVGQKGKGMRTSDAQKGRQKGRRAERSIHE